MPLHRLCAVLGAHGVSVHTPGISVPHQAAALSTGDSLGFSRTPKKSTGHLVGETIRLEAAHEEEGVQPASERFVLQNDRKPRSETKFFASDIDTETINECGLPLLLCCYLMCMREYQFCQR